MEMKENKKKEGYVCVCVTGGKKKKKKKKNGLGKSAQPEKKTELRESFGREGG